MPEYVAGHYLAFDNDKVFQWLSRRPLWSERPGLLPFRLHPSVRGHHTLAAAILLLPRGWTHPVAGS